MKPIIETKTVEEVTGYLADDGTWFRSKEECSKYEASALYAAERAAFSRRISSAYAEDALRRFCTCLEEVIEVYDIATADDLQIVNTYLRMLEHSSATPQGLIDPKYIGSKVAVDIWCDRDGFTVWGSREEVEAEFKKCLDKWFTREAESDAES